MTEIERIDTDIGLDLVKGNQSVDPGQGLALAQKGWYLYLSTICYFKY